jgi:hypothetical protein
MALLVAVEEINWAGSVLCLLLFREGTLDQSEVKLELLGRRLAWERHLLGHLVSGSWRIACRSNINTIALRGGRRAPI